MDGITFQGTDILRYYYYLYQNMYAGYPWQIEIAYCIVIISLLFLFGMTMYFLWKYYRTKRREKKQKIVSNKYQEEIECLMLDETISEEDLFARLQIIASTHFESQYFIRLLINTRLKYPEKKYFKHIQVIANELGITNYIEYNLLTKRYVFRSLQCMIMMQLEIAEGRLSNYTSCHDPQIRSFARIAYMYCSNNEPYKFLFYELETDRGQINCMLMHYVFEWMHIRGKVLPNFIYYAKKLQNHESAAFMINEMRYYSLYLKKDDLSYFYVHSHPVVKAAAIRQSAGMEYDDIVDILLPSYFEQTEFVKKEIIDAFVLSGKEKSVDTLIYLYENSVSKLTKENILLLLSTLGKPGIYGFGALKKRYINDAGLFNDVESIVGLETIKEMMQD